MTPNMERGARIIIHEWVKVRVWDKVLIVTSKEYLAEAKAMEKEASGKARSVNTLLVENKGRHVEHSRHSAKSASQLAHSGSICLIDLTKCFIDCCHNQVFQPQSVRYKDTRNFCPCHWQPMTEDLFWNTIS